MYSPNKREETASTFTAKPSAFMTNYRTQLAQVSENTSSSSEFSERVAKLHPNHNSLRYQPRNRLLR